MHTFGNARSMPRVHLAAMPTAGTVCDVPVRGRPVVDMQCHLWSRSTSCIIHVTGRGSAYMNACYTDMRMC